MTVQYVFVNEVFLLSLTWEFSECSTFLTLYSFFHQFPQQPIQPFENDTHQPDSFVKERFVSAIHITLVKEMKSTLAAGKQ